MSSRGFDLWKAHELGDAEEPQWEGSEGLLDNALMLVVENEMCGRLNGERMRARAAAAEHAVDVGAARGKGSCHSAKKCPVENVVVWMQATHNEPRAASRPAEQYRQLRSG